ncbi:MAG: hypothetical protein PUH02_06440 [bacterium]|nr:hypothetical protein [bacterium]
MTIIKLSICLKMTQKRYIFGREDLDKMEKMKRTRSMLTGREEKKEK